MELIEEINKLIEDANEDINIDETRKAVYNLIKAARTVNGGVFNVKNNVISLDVQNKFRVEFKIDNNKVYYASFIYDEKKNKYVLNYEINDSVQKLNSNRELLKEIKQDLTSITK